MDDWSHSLYPQRPTLLIYPHTHDNTKVELVTFQRSLIPTHSEASQALYGHKTYSMPHCSVIFSYVYYKFPEFMCVAFIQFESINWHVLEEFPEIFCVTSWSRFHLVCCRDCFSPGATQTSMFKNVNYWSQSIKFSHERAIFWPQPLRIRAPFWAWPLRSGHRFTKETVSDSGHNYFMQHATYELNKWNGSHSGQFLSPSNPLLGNTGVSVKCSSIL